MNRPDGVVAEIYIGRTQGGPLQGVERVAAVCERGLEGDRYFSGEGYYSDRPGWGAHVTLIQAEAIEAVNVGHGEEFTGAMLRRNIVTRGVDLNQLLDALFRCGDVVLRGVKQYPPCGRLAYLIGVPEALRYFAYCGGIGAEVVASGEIAVGDKIQRLDSQAPE